MRERGFEHSPIGCWPWHWGNFYRAASTTSWQGFHIVASLNFPSPPATQHSLCELHNTFMLGPIPMSQSETNLMRTGTDRFFFEDPRQVHILALRLRRTAVNGRGSTPYFESRGQSQYCSLAGTSFSLENQYRQVQWDPERSVSCPFEVSRWGLVEGLLDSTFRV